MMLNNEQTKRLRSIELDLLKETIRVCECLGLSYFIVGGTLLGAVRHQGFIPWDDDIDIGMLREDFEVFVTEGPKLFGECYFLQTTKTDPEFIQNFAKVRNSNTTFLETSQSKLNINHGVFIDIFPFDYFPDSHIGACLFNIKKQIFHFRLQKEFYWPEEKQNKSKKLYIQLILRSVAKLLCPSAKKALQAEDRLFKSVSSSTLICNNCGAWGKREIANAEWFKYTTLLEFEDMRLKAPCGYSDYLQHVYGDYMSLPPLEKRISHHYTEIIDLENSYKKYK